MCTLRGLSARLLKVPLSRQVWYGVLVHLIEDLPTHIETHLFHGSAGGFESVVINNMS